MKKVLTVTFAAILVVSCFSSCSEEEIQPSIEIDDSQSGQSQKGTLNVGNANVASGG